MDEHKKPSVIGPGALSFLLILLLHSKENTQEKLNNAHEMFDLFIFLLLLVSTIWVWQKYLKEYVAFSIEQKLRDVNKKPED